MRKLAAAGLLLMAAPGAAQSIAPLRAPAPPPPPVGDLAPIETDFLIIAHRGASAERPEHTLAAYELAIDQGAHYIEPDLVVTKDLVLVARHENELSETTDIASREAFADRRRTKRIDGRLVSGWFAEDLTLDELRSLRARERIPGIRPDNARFDGLYSVPTFAEIVQLVRAKEAETGRQIGLYPELKHPEFLLQSEGIDAVDLLLAELRQLGINAGDPIFIQCFEIAPLQRLAQRSEYKLVQLIHPRGGPADEPALTYADMLTEAGLANIAEYADGIGVGFPALTDDRGRPNGVLALAKAQGLLVHGWTLRLEEAFLPEVMRAPGLTAAQGQFRAMVGLTMLKQDGLDGVFTDHVCELTACARRSPAVLQQTPAN